LRLTALISLLALAHVPAFSQYYFTGEVDGLHGDKLQHVLITVLSSGSVYRTSVDGDFAITSRLPVDTVTFQYDGYESYTTTIRSTQVLKVTLNTLAAPREPKKVSLLSLQDGPTKVFFADHSNGVSYQMVKRFLQMGSTVPAEAVKIEELVNYFNTTYELPDSPACFHASSAIMDCPWNNGHRLLLLNISGRKANMERIPPNNLVLLIDVSGSMDMPNKLPLIKASLRPLIRNLRATDTVSIVQFGADMRVMAGIPGSAKDVLAGAIEQLQPDGSSPGCEGLKLAYAVARHQFIPEGNNRIIFVTDGDVCNDNAQVEAMGDYIAQQSDEGIRLSCIGVGTDDSTSRELPYFAGQGRGRFIPVAEEEQGERVLLKEMAVGAIADDVSVTAEFDTTLGTGYRLLGFDNKPGVPSDTALLRSSVASGQSLMALFEFVPRRDTTGVFAKIHIDYCLPGRTVPQRITYDCPGTWVPWDRATACERRAVGVTLFGMKLRGDSDGGVASWGEVQKLNKMVFPGNNFIDREYLSLIAKAKKIYESKDDRSAAIRE
jgi:Ca-activated chloride channel family protein